MTAASSWFDELKAWSVADVAARFGLELVRRGADVSFACPACGKSLRHSRGADTRKAAKVMPDNRWWCEPCGAAGDVVALVASLVTGATSPERDRWREVRSACVDVGLVIGEPGQRPVIAYSPPPPPERVPAVERAPAAEVEAFWSACSPVRADSDAGRYLSARHLLGPCLKHVDPAPWTDVVRAAPTTLTSPVDWWTGAWIRRWPLVFPAYDAEGRLASVHARAVERTAEPKTRWPRGCSASGLLFADVMGVGFLRNRAAGLSVEGLEAVVIVEGATDTLKLARVVEAADATLAVLGYVAGSKHAVARIDWPAEVIALVSTDDDETGDKYAAEIRAALPSAVMTYRLRPPRSRGDDGRKGADWADCTDAEVLEVLETGSQWEVLRG